MDERERISPAQKYEESVRAFEDRQGRYAKETKMTSKSNDALIQKVKDLFKTENHNYIIGRNKLEDKVRWISMQRVYLGAGLVLAIAIGGFVWGISNNEQAEEKLKETKNKIKETKLAVQGNHLTNIPKDYSAWADEEASKHNKNRHLEKVVTALPVENVYEEGEDTEPADEKVLIYDTYAEREHQRVEDLRLKAKESPIAFELKNGN